MKGIKIFKKPANTLLNDILVETPITQVGEPNTTNNSSNTRNVSKCSCIVTLLNNKMEVHICCVRTGSKVCIYSAQSSKSICSEHLSHLAQGNKSCNQTTTYKEGNLHNVCPCNRCKTTVDRIDTCNKEKEEDNQHTDADSYSKYFNCHSLQTKNLLNGNSTKPCYRGEVHKYVKEQPQN